MHWLWSEWFVWFLCRDWRAGLIVTDSRSERVRLWAIGSSVSGEERSLLVADFLAGAAVAVFLSLFRVAVHTPL